MYAPFSTVCSGPNYATPDSASVFFQLPVVERDRFRTAFQDAPGSLWEYNRCGFGLKILPAAFSRLVSDALGALKGRGVEHWLDGVINFTMAFDEHLESLQAVMQHSVDSGLSVKAKKCAWALPQQDTPAWLLIATACALHSKVDAIAQLTSPSSEQLQASLGVTGYLREFVYRARAALLTKLLRDKRFASERTRMLTIPWGAKQEAAFVALQDALV